MRGRAVFALLVAFVLLIADGVAAEFHCSWAIRAKGQKVDPFEIDEGINKYIITTTGRDGMRKVASELKALPMDSDVMQIREMLALGNMLTAKLSQRGIRWLCSQEQLDKLIVYVELDQTVTLLSRHFQ